MGNEQSSKVRSGGGYYIGGFRDLTPEEASKYCPIANTFDPGFIRTLEVGTGGIITAPAVWTSNTIESIKCNVVARHGYRVVPGIFERPPQGGNLYLTSANYVITYNKQGQALSKSINDLPSLDTRNQLDG